ncbi:hypothetical protein A1O7_06154 [Cladophialophora yegresii CBS 114405]|uniref:ATPase inhibitor, mitochondrial n=1 Tax=Cladophialophora yegresii CBS 114405 TaxID=1182544 RepID=W9W168_9EURO|nr:uncharacterized protein A1O7_06154 [Cladophialophora yegresii CBS 114405]EXJ58725.1 hypothetical protein A1O7_06154 [Cladophialophora yegresii CBS 114405]
MPRICATRIRTPQFCQSQAQTFVTSRPFLSAGDTGAVRQGGTAASFNRREQVLENMYFKQHEMEK